MSNTGDMVIDLTQDSDTDELEPAQFFKLAHRSPVSSAPTVPLKRKLETSPEFNWKRKTITPENGIGNTAVTVPGDGYTHAHPPRASPSNDWGFNLNNNKVGAQGYANAYERNLGNTHAQTQGANNRETKYKIIYEDDPIPTHEHNNVPKLVDTRELNRNNNIMSHGQNNKVKHNLSQEISNGNGHKNNHVQNHVQNNVQNHIASRVHKPVKNHLQNLSTPSSGPEARLSALSVVIPSPSGQLKKEIASASWIGNHTELTGMSEKHYPVDVHEKRAMQGAYPAAKKVNRSKIPFSIGAPGPVLTQKTPTGVQKQLQKTLERKLQMIKGPPVTFAPADENLLAQFAANFEFINSYKLRKGVKPIDADFIGGCSCQTVCDPEYCMCLDKEDQDEDEDEDQDMDDQNRGNQDKTRHTIIPYQCAQDDSRLFVLNSEFRQRKRMIQECGPQCGCDEKCWNRVVQRGRTVRLEIFSTGNRGFGLRSPDRIRAGQYIDCYLGEVITKPVAEVRGELSNGVSYLFDLDWFKDTVPEDEMYVVDGQKFGAPTRFMNHSCNPNCRMFTASHTGDDRLYDLAFFALKEIPPMTELTFDYNPGEATTTNVKIDPNAVRCLCGESNCRGQLWPNQRKGTK